MKSQCCFSTGHEVFPWFRGIYIYTHTRTHRFPLKMRAREEKSIEGVDRRGSDGIEYTSIRFFSQKVDLNNYCCHICFFELTRIE